MSVRSNKKRQARMPVLLKMSTELDHAREIAERIAIRMSAKMQVALPTGVAAERVLESIAYTMRAQSRR